MALQEFVNRVRVLVANTPGTGNITIGAAYSVLHFTPTEAGAADGEYDYVVLDGTTIVEEGRGTLSGAGTIFARDTVARSKIAGASGTTKATLTANAVLALVPLAASLRPLAKVPVVAGEAMALSDTQKAQVRASVYDAPLDAMAYNGLETNSDHSISQELVDTALTGLNVGSYRYGSDGYYLYVNGGAAVASMQRVTDVPNSGFEYSSKVTVTTANAAPGSADGVLWGQYIEGFRGARLGFGGAAAMPFVIAEYLKSSVTGRFYYSARNSGGSRSIIHGVDLVANTWAFNAFRLPECTDGTWTKGNANFMSVDLLLMAGSTAGGGTVEDAWQTSNNRYAKSDTANLFATNGATFQRTGLKILPGLTSLELPVYQRLQLLRRPIVHELPLCQRQLQYLSFSARFLSQGGGNNFPMRFNDMRAIPAATISGGSRSNIAAITIDPGTGNLTTNSLAVNIAATSNATDTSTFGEVIKLDARF